MIEEEADGGIKEDTVYPHSLRLCKACREAGSVLQPASQILHVIS